MLKHQKKIPITVKITYLSYVQNKRKTELLSFRFPFTYRNYSISK